MGFYCFTQPTPPEVLTTKQQVRALTDDQRLALLKGFKESVPPGQLDHKLGLAKEIIQDVYNIVSNIQETARSYMRQEIIVTPAVMSGTFPPTVITPAVMNTQPYSTGDLKDILKPMFQVDVPISFTSLVVDEMITWTKYDGTGNWNFYKTNIVL